MEKGNLVRAAAANLWHMAPRRIIPPNSAFPDCKLRKDDCYHLADRAELKQCALGHGLVAAGMALSKLEEVTPGPRQETDRNAGSRRSPKELLCRSLDLSLDISE